VISAAHWSEVSCLLLDDGPQGEVPGSPGSGARSASVGIYINASGQVVGYANRHAQAINDAGQERAFRLTPR
jgi:hypothetical protein